MRENDLSNRVLESYAGFLDRSCTASSKRVDQPRRTTSIGMPDRPNAFKSTRMGTRAAAFVALANMVGASCGGRCHVGATRCHPSCKRLQNPRSIRE